MFRFVPDGVGGIGTKRKLPHRTCETCKKRHKRCSHMGYGADSDDRAPETGSSVGTTPDVTPNTGARGQGEHSAGALSDSESRQSSQAHHSRDLTHSGQTRKAVSRLLPQGSESLRFVGDLSPEATFLDTRSRPNEGRVVSRHDDVGIWLGPKPAESAKVDGRNGRDHDQVAELLSSSLSAPSRLKMLSPLLRQECLTTIPPEHEYGLLSTLYFAKFDPIFPILQGGLPERRDAMETVALKQCICLIAAMDPSMASHLCLLYTEEKLLQADFRERIAGTIKQSLDMGFIRDSVVLLQVSALMAFYADETSFSSDISARFCALAVHHSQTLGLHIGWPDHNGKGEKSRRIFWCVWILDRLNAAVNGRPVLMHARDMDRRILESIKTQDPPFRLCISIAKLLDETISQYRPHGSDAICGPTDEDQAFEDLVSGSDAVGIGSTLLVSLEMFYLAVMILRSRPKRTEGVHQPLCSALQIFYATTIVSIASEEYKQELTYWPVVPYAVSMATSIAYKSLRNNPIHHNRKRAYTLFHNSHEALEALSKLFISAREVALLASNTVNEIERVAADVSKAHPTGAASGQASDSRTGAQSVSQGYAEQASAGQLPEADTLTPPSTSVALSQAQFGAEPYDPASFNDCLADTSIFSRFDPTFDLDRIDAFFDANLDPSVPQFSGDWY